VHVSCGGVIYRFHGDIIEVLLLHRRRPDTWHLPKGTRRPGESLEQTARREVKEETGLDLDIESYLGYLPSTFQRDGQTVQKITHYFRMLPRDSPTGSPDHEHDEGIWKQVDEARELLASTHRRFGCEAEHRVVHRRSLHPACVSMP